MQWVASHFLNEERRIKDANQFPKDQKIGMHQTKKNTWRLLKLKFGRFVFI